MHKCSFITVLSSLCSTYLDNILTKPIFSCLFSPNPYSFNNYVFNAYYIRGFGDTSVNKSDKIPTLIKLTI